MAQNLYPGGRLLHVYSIDDAAVLNSMAAAIEDEMSQLYKAVKHRDLPETGSDDRRILFIAIARGVLRHLHDAQAGNIATQPVGTIPALPVTLTINMESAT